MAYKNAPILSITWYTILIIKKLVSSCQNKFKITDVMWNIMTLIIIKPCKQTWHFTSNINFSYLMTSIFDLALWYQNPSLYSVQFFFYDKWIFGMANWLSKDTYGTLAVLARKWATVMGESIIQAHSSCSRPTRVWNLPPYRNIIQKYYSFQLCWWELSVHVHKMLQHYM